jgi:hypothetical protein
MIDDPEREQRTLTEIDVIRTQRNNLMARLLELEVQLAMQDDELRRLRGADPQR